MPPKRGAPSSSGAANGSKKSKTDSAGSSNNNNAVAVSSSKRWAAVSGSRNADAEYKLVTKDPVRAYSYNCICRAPFNDDDDDDDEDEDEEEDASNDRPANRCDGGKSCLCGKPAVDHPEHLWVLTMAGFRKFVSQRIQVELRDPDSFGMYTFNDHAGYGVLQVVQNLLLDFVEAEDNWKEQWVVCEATALFLLDDNTAGPMGMIDDSEAVTDTHRLLGRMFLTMLAKLERQDLLKADSEVKNLGVVMALYVKLAATWRSDDVLSDNGEDDDGKKSQEDSDKNFRFQASRLDAHILNYATKHKIKLRGPSDIDELVGELSEDELAEVGQPPASDDPWGWDASFKQYTKDHAEQHRGPKRIGGDSLDITTWSSAERKEQSFDKKDPLGKKERDAIKQGMVLQLG